MNNHVDEQYISTLLYLMRCGERREGRNGVTYSSFGRQLRFDLSKGFPLLTTKFVHFHSVLVELLWFLKGDTNIKFLHDHNVKIWDEWADENGDLGPVYGKQWRNFNSVDQLVKVIDGIKKDPYGRRHIVSAWNPAEVDNMALPPCHTMFQFYINNGKLSCQLYQRSADWFLGVPFNIASYALLTHLIARETGYHVGEFIHTFGDYHLYENHMEAALQQIRNPSSELPYLDIFDDVGTDIFNLQPYQIKIQEYKHAGRISAPVSK